MTREAWIDELRAEGLDVTEWRDDPDAAYEEHSHEHREVRIVLDGEMTVWVRGAARVLRAGDRIDLAPGEPHSAKVGSEGVRYLAGSDR